MLSAEQGNFASAISGNTPTTNGILPPPPTSCARFALNSTESRLSSVFANWSSLYLSDSLFIYSVRVTMTVVMEMQLMKWILSLINRLRKWETVDECSNYHDVPVIRKTRASSVGSALGPSSWGNFARMHCKDDITATCVSLDMTWVGKCFVYGLRLVCSLRRMCNILFLHGGNIYGRLAILQFSFDF